MTTDEQSVSGMKPMRTSFFSGASEPAAQAAERIAGTLMSALPAARLRPWRMKPRRVLMSFSWLISQSPEGRAPFGGTVSGFRRRHKKTAPGACLENELRMPQTPLS
jgi:hypothetical protein